MNMLAAYAVPDAAPKTLPALLKVRDSLRDKGFADLAPPDYEPQYKEDFDYLALFLLGQELGLWSFWATVHGKPHVYAVEYLGELRQVPEPDARGWIMGVLDTLGLGYGPFTEGLGLTRE